MSTVTTLPHSRPLTRADLAAMPEDGHRYELVDGTLLVTPAPSWQHQAVAFELAKLLDRDCPAEFKVFMAPVDVVLSDTTVLEPDVLVARRSDLGARDLTAVPLLAVEVLSPSTRHIDLMLKRSRVEAAGCPSYWVVDPIELVLTAWDLRDGAYVKIAEVAGDDELAATRPYPVVIAPAALRGA